MKNHTRKLLLRTSGLIALIGVPALAGAQSPSPANAVAPSTAAVGPAAPTADEAGYIYGVNFGEQLYRLGITTQIPIDSLARGLKDGMAGKKTMPADARIVMQYLKSLTDALLVQNRAAAKEFLDHNATEKGVKKTPSGLQYKIIAAGNPRSAAPQPSDTVTVQYSGKLIDGTEFDSSYSRGIPATFAVGGVIKGWQEALTLMKPGAKWRLFVPPELGYDTTLKPGIPVGSLLIFEVELLSIATPPKPAPPAAKTNAPDAPINQDATSNAGGPAPQAKLR